MKFSAFAFAIIIGAANADFNLRAAANQFLGYNGNDNSSSDVAEARVVVHGMKHQATPWDLAIISKNALDAYNHAYEAAGFSITSFKAESTATIPETVGVMQPDCTLCPPDDDTLAVADASSNGQLVLATIKLGLKQPDCTLCPPDDDSSAAVVSAVDLAFARNKFEQQFCAGLRASNSKNLANVRDCSFTFLDMPGQPAENMPVHASHSFRAGEDSEAQVLIHGTVREFTKKDMELVDQSILAAYNHVFSSSAGMTLNAVETVADVDIPLEWNQPDCTLCPPDDDVAVISSAKLIVARVSPVEWSQPDCTLCPPDDDNFQMQPVEDETLALLHQAFEKNFCNKLKKSGNDNFAMVSDCRFRFVHNIGVESEQPAAQF